MNKEMMAMKKEDLWMVIVVAFSILWVVFMGIGGLG